MPIIVSTVEGYRLCKNATKCNHELGNNSMLEFHVLRKHSMCFSQCVDCLSVCLSYVLVYYVCVSMTKQHRHYNSLTPSKF